MVYLSVPAMLISHTSSCRNFSSPVLPICSSSENVNICTWVFAGKEKLSLITPEPSLCPYWQQKCISPSDSLVLICRQWGRGTSEVCEQSCHMGADGSVTCLQTAPQTVIPEFHLFHRVLKTVCFQWGFRLIHSVCKVSLLSSHLHTVSSLCTCSLAMDYIAWLVSLSSKVSEFQPSANCPKPV